MDKKNGKERAQANVKQMLTTQTHQTRPYFIPRKHCQFSMAGLLTCNIFAILPIPLYRDSGYHLAKTFYCYLQLRDSP